ncbi:hypothetical protein I215_09386 [Galbibacter marinus]|uniref:DUF4138 domain-containing protein n=1 Tax=Galbibacter marinus TaxID=555500 RepID=K2PU11_9FLAO|nr:DUF4138 domain-containing protein [Galbibacter marinus]EKF55064.1 hypothetical protein I215_09386 [Galbibacter marinus]
MKNYIITLVAILLTLPMDAQRPLETLYANNSKNVALFFPSPIRQAVTGSSNFVFTYNREKKQYFGLLQATPGKQSNLLVVTDDGAVYSFILEYSDSLSKLNYFISKERSIGTELPMAETKRSNKKKLDSTSNGIKEFESFGDYLLAAPSKNLKTKRQKGLKLQLQRIAYKGSQTYLVMEITNTSGITFEIDFLKVFSVSGNKKRKASFQKKELKPIYSYKLPSKVHNSESYRFVYVLPKFVLGDKEKLQLELQELNGSRKVILKTRL